LDTSGSTESAEGLIGNVTAIGQVMRPFEIRESEGDWVLLFVTARTNGKGSDARTGRGVKREVSELSLEGKAVFMANLSCDMRFWGRDSHPRNPEAESSLP